MGEIDGTQFRWTGELPVGAEVKTVVIDFGRTRTTLRGVTIETSLRDVSVPLDIEGLVASVTFEPQLVVEDEPATVTVIVDFDGDAPRPSRVTVNGGKSLRIKDWFPDGLPEKPPDQVIDRLWALERERLALPVTMSEPAGRGSEVSEAEGRGGTGEVVSRLAPLTESAKTSALFAERLRAIRWDAALRRVFYEHDLDTNGLISPVEWDPAMRDVSTILDQRIQNRIHYAQVCQWPKFDELPKTAQLHSYLAKTSAHFVRAFLALEAESRGGLLDVDGNEASVELFDWAFEQFVCGNLTTRHNDYDWQVELLLHGTPNGHMFLQYAECAIYCLENGLDAEFWKPKLRTLIRCAHIFLESAAPLLNVPYPKAQTIFKFDPDRYYPRARRKELREEYSKPELGYGKVWAEEFDDLRARFGALLKTALLPMSQKIKYGHGDILQRHHCKLKPQGVGAEASFTCAQEVSVS